MHHNAVCSDHFPQIIYKKLLVYTSGINNQDKNCAETSKTGQFMHCSQCMKSFKCTQNELDHMWLWPIGRHQRPLWLAISSLRVLPITPAAPAVDGESRKGLFEPGAASMKVCLLFKSTTEWSWNMYDIQSISKSQSFLLLIFPIEKVGVSKTFYYYY